MRAKPSLERKPRFDAAADDIDYSDSNMRFAMKFAISVLDDVFTDAIKIVKFKRELNHLKKVLRRVLTSRTVPADLTKLTNAVY